MKMITSKSAALAMIASVMLTAAAHADVPATEAPAPSGVWVFDEEATAAALRKSYDENIVQIGLLAMRGAFISFGPEPGQVSLMGSPGEVTATCSWATVDKSEISLSGCLDRHNKEMDPKQLGRPIIYENDTLLLQGESWAVLWYKKLVVE